MGAPLGIDGCRIQIRCMHLRTGNPTGRRVDQYSCSYCILLTVIGDVDNYAGQDTMAIRRESVTLERGTTGSGESHVNSRGLQND